jgi:hypothetical protein
LVDLIEKCGGRGRIAPIENNSINEERKEAQVVRIIEMVELIKLKNNKKHFSNIAFLLATAYTLNYRSEEITKDTIAI